MAHYSPQAISVSEAVLMLQVCDNWEDREVIAMEMAVMIDGKTEPLSYWWTEEYGRPIEGLTAEAARPILEQAQVILWMEEL
jgi:hypothetical protein